jgi:hypothetical protein
MKRKLLQQDSVSTAGINPEPVRDSKIGKGE